MLQNTLIDNAKVMSKGQITIPKDIRTALGVSCGDRVTFIVEGNTVRIVNSAIFAMQTLQKEMENEPKLSEDEVMALVRNERYGDSNEGSD